MSGGCDWVRALSLCLKKSAIMKAVRYWLVSPSQKWVKSVPAKNCAGALRERARFIVQYPDLTICTNECATTFGHGLRFSNGKLYTNE